MPNLTGDFDVIAQFAVPAVNRILAAMHSIERFPHSTSMRVDDTSRPDIFDRPPIVGLLDVFGDAVSDHTRVRNPRPVNLGDFPMGSSGGRVAAALDAVANIDLSDLQIEPLQPSNLKGKAQVQIFPPTIELTPGSGSKVTVKMEVIARYLPDPNTPPVAQFIRGDVRITADVSHVVSQVANVVSIKLRSSTAAISFTPQWSSTPISAADLLGVNQLIRNALKSSVLPSTATLPANISSIQFRALGGTSGAVAVLLDMSGPAGNPASATQVFLAGSDGFAFGVGADFVKAAFEPALEEIRNQQPDPVKFKIESFIHTWHITYVLTLNQVTLELENGKMVLVIKGHAHTGTSWLPNFNFTVKQNMTLAVTGDTAEIAFGSASIDTSSVIVDIFKSRALAMITNMRDAAVARSGLQQKIRKLFSAEGNLGGFLRSLLTPVNPNAPVVPLQFSLSYTSAEIRDSGIVMHGDVAVAAWPPPRVEYEPVPHVAGGFHGIDAASGPDHSALKSWIPGGTIQSFEWHRMGSQGTPDTTKFILIDRGPVVSPGGGVMARTVGGFSPLCLTLRGTRLSPDGPVTAQPVSGTICGYLSFPIFDIAISNASVALARRGADGNVEVVGHAQPARASAAMAAPNLIVHFAGDEDSTEALVEAVHQSGRADAAAAIVVVASPSSLSRMRFSDEVAYADNPDEWRKRYGIKSGGPATVVVDGEGRTVWHGEGRVNRQELPAILGKVLSKSPPGKATMVTTNARIGQPAPNFLLEHAPGDVISLRKLSGKKVDIVFARQSSGPSMDAVRRMAGGGNRVIAVIADEVSKESLGDALLVRDRGGKIAAAYGVTAWPTIVSLDGNGIVRNIGYGNLSGGDKSRV